MKPPHRPSADAPMVRHHPDDATLMSFASGGLSQALSVAVAAHAWNCPHCRRELKLLDAIGMVCLRDLEASELHRPMPLLALGSLEADIDGLDIHSRPADADIPLPIALLAGHRLADIAWSSMATGVQQHLLTVIGDTGGQLRLLKIEAGRKIPEHGHGSTELTLVLHGAFRDAYGEFKVGDLADVDEEVDHSPIADPVIGCICLIASDAPPKFRGLLARLARPFLKP